MVRSESAEEEMLDEKIDDADDQDDDDFGPSWSQRSANGNTALRDPASSSESPPSGANDSADRRLRRQIANCNERRRMQSINAGFQSLRALLPRRDGEKLSKAAILQQTAELIQTLQAERTRLLDERDSRAIWKKRRVDDDAQTYVSDAAVEAELRLALERERNLRVVYEQQLAALQASLQAQQSAPRSAFSSPALPEQLSPSGAQQRSVIKATPEAYDSLPAPVPRHVTVACETSPPATIRTQTTPNASAFSSTRNLNAILEAIRHLEGAAFGSSPPQQPATSCANLMVR